MDFGVFTLGDHLPNPHLGRYGESQAEKHQAWVSEGILAEQHNFSSVWLGEHHFNEYILTVPQMLLTAIGVQTNHIRLGTAVTLLANHDPVRIAEDFATLDLLSGGRAEMGIAPGITPATFRLFGQNPDEAQEMMFEKLDLLLRLWTEDEVNWTGRYRVPFTDARVEPRTATGGPLPVWIGTGVSTEKAQAAGRAGHKLQVATIFGTYEAFAPVVDAYRTAYTDAGHDPAHMEVAAIIYCYLDDNDPNPADTWAPYMANYRQEMRNLVRGNGTTAGIEALGRIATASDLEGGWRACDMWGSADRITDAVLTANEDFGGIDHLLCYFDAGGMPHEMVENSIRQFGEQVIPAVTNELTADLPG